MKNIRIFPIYAVIISFLTATLLPAAPAPTDREFEAKKEVRIKLVLSGCELTTSTNGKIQVHHESTYDPERYKAIMEEKGDRLILEEKFYENENSGDAYWKISVPPGTEVEFNTATGDLNVKSFSGELDGNSGTGDIEVEKAEGEFDLNSGTGDVIIRASSGEFDLNSGTGSVKISEAKGDFRANSGTGRCQANDIMILHDGEFNSGTGNVLVERPIGDDFDLNINSGTGDAILDLNGLPLVGYFEFKAQAQRGDIECPVEFDEEEKGGREDHEYQRKSFTRERKSPRYFISTGTGTAELKL